MSTHQFFDPYGVIAHAILKTADVANITIEPLGLLFGNLPKLYKLSYRATYDVHISFTSSPEDLVTDKRSTSDSILATSEDLKLLLEGSSVEGIWNGGSYSGKLVYRGD